MKVRVAGRLRDYKTVWMERGRVRMIDQRLLPERFRIHTARTVGEVAKAIREMVVRGAPAIGAAAAYGMALGALARDNVMKDAALLLRTRPTAHDLSYAVREMERAIRSGWDPVAAAQKYARNLEAVCLEIGRQGEPLLEGGSTVLTHCNAGALATVDHGTALAPIRRAHRRKKRLFVYVDETRPRLQGAKLTAWELKQEGIDYAIISDSAAGYYLLQGKVDCVLVGADRITSSGDFANKVGTYPLAVLAKENGVPFYVAAPRSTFDFTIDHWKQIPIEERDPLEVLKIEDRRIAPVGAEARNPAFDVTPGRYVTKFVTERGLFSPKQVHGLASVKP